MSHIIYVDTRETNLINQLNKMDRINFVVKQLDIADVIITDDRDNMIFGIERKRCDDCIASVRDGRYKDQKKREL